MSEASSSLDNGILFPHANRFLLVKTMHSTVYLLATCAYRYSLELQDSEISSCPKLVPASFRLRSLVIGLNHSIDEIGKSTYKGD